MSIVFSFFLKKIFSPFSAAGKRGRKYDTASPERSARTGIFRFSAFVYAEQLCRIGVREAYIYALLHKIGAGYNGDVAAVSVDKLIHAAGIKSFQDKGLPRLIDLAGWISMRKPSLPSSVMHIYP